MSYKPDTVQVPRAIIRGVAEGNFYPNDVYYAALRMMYPKQDPAAIAEKFDIKYTQKVDRFFEAGTAPSSSSQPRQDYPEAPPAPDGFLESLQADINERGEFKRELRPNVANAIYEAANGDDELIGMAVALMEDYHNNGQEVMSPGAVILTTLKKRSAEQIRDDYDKITRGGTAVGNRERRMTRAMERTEDYVKSGSAVPEPNREFLGREDENE